MEHSDEYGGSQGLETLSLGVPSRCSNAHAPLPHTPFNPGGEHGAPTDPEDAVQQATFGAACDPGGRPYQDDRNTAFSVRLRDGRRLSVAAVLDGHHGHELSHLISTLLPQVFVAAAEQFIDLSQALCATVRSLDDAAFLAHQSGQHTTGGTTILILVLTQTTLYIANVGDCKAVLSSKGAPEALSQAHNPPVPSERQRFETACVPCFADHIGGSDINVCRTIGDYDLGSPLKWRDPGSAAPQGPLISDPEITVRALESLDEFVVIASDGLWDYYTPESSVVTEARRHLRASENDAQACAEWLVREALLRQRGILHSSTHGDNVTVMLVQLRPVPHIPRTSASRLNLRRSNSDTSNGSQPTPPAGG